MAVAVCAGSTSLQPQAEALSRHLQLPLLSPGSNPQDCTEVPVLLMVEEQGLALQQTGVGAPGAVRVELGGGAMRHRRKGGHNELLGKAVGIGRKEELHVLDATAGLARDAFVLADLGCRVTLCERNGVIGAMLDEALTRGLEDADTWQRKVVSRMQLVVCDAVALSLEQLGSVDVIYLDPMFPVRGKHAAVKKDMALFQQVLATDDLVADTEALMRWALEQDVARVVVKRPRKSSLLPVGKLSHQISGKAVRYDVYVKRGLVQDS